MDDLFNPVKQTRFTVQEFESILQSGMPVDKMSELVTYRLEGRTLDLMLDEFYTRLRDGQGKVLYR